jgi:2-polyprenyl-6-methoxyphenol hydroxylase-like FAD-dependent oxidoreductase
VDHLRQGDRSSKKHNKRQKFIGDDKLIHNKNILISGAGIAGLTLAYWLQKRGFSPTIIEKRPDLNDRGYMIDFYGSGFDVADKMGLVEALQEKSDQYKMENISFVDNQGKARATLSIEQFKQVMNHRYFPLMRGDLGSTLYDSVKDNIPVRFGTSIRVLQEQPNGITAELSDGTSETYDLVIGADGIHSNVRKLLWGSESLFNHFLGFYVVCGVIENIFDQPIVCFGHFEPNTQTTVYSIGDNKLATFFAFRSGLLNIHGREAQMNAFSNVMGNLGWVVPQLVESTNQAENFFFDAVTQIQLDQWYKGRVSLVGDACQCLTLLAGQGASMGMAGAYMLAEELHKADGDHKIAFPTYQQKLKPEIESRQKDARGLAGSFVPRNRFEIAMSHFFLNAAFLPGFRTLFRKQIGAQSIIK